MLAAVRNPLVDVLGHATGRLLIGRDGGKSRPESQFDADKVFAACKEHDVAVEINSRPERLDPPRRLLTLAVEIGCRFSIDTDAHAPGQLDWQIYGCARAEECGVDAATVVNTMDADGLLAWAKQVTPSEVTALLVLDPVLAAEHPPESCRQFRPDILQRVDVVDRITLGFGQPARRLRR